MVLINNHVLVLTYMWNSIVWNEILLIMAISSKFIWSFLLNLFLSEDVVQALDHSSVVVPLACYAQTEVLRTYGLLLPTHWGVIHWRTEHMHMVGSTKTYIFIDAEVSLRKWKTWYIETKTMKKVRSRYIVNMIMGILSWRYLLKQYASIMSKMRWSA